MPALGQKRTYVPQQKPLDHHVGAGEQLLKRTLSELAVVP
jgi:hypothetical protein